MIETIKFRVRLGVRPKLLWRADRVHVVDLD